MALRDQPYIPLYVQDFVTDEKLAQCSAESTGVYVRILCAMHKSEEYGKVLLRQKDMQNESKIKNFASKLVKQMPYKEQVIEEAIEELIEEGVLFVDGNYLCQKRMIKDNSISMIRREAGKKTSFANAKTPTKKEQNTEYEIEYENKDIYSGFISFLNTSLCKKYKGESKSKSQLKARVKEGFTLDQIKTAITNAANDSYHKETKFKYLTPEFLTRADKVDKFLNIGEAKDSAKTEDHSLRDKFHEA